MTPVPLHTRRLQLVTPEPTEILAWLESLPADQRSEVSPQWLDRVRTLKQADPWALGFRILLKASGESIGSIGFRHPPGPHGTVEIAYGIDPEHQGQGFATEACEAVTGWTFGSGRVDRIIAHTRLDGHASMRVLSRNGFRRVGEVQDPEDGTVCRWERLRETR